MPIRSRWSRALAWIVAGAALGGALLVAPVATASCAGPQLVLSQRDQSLTARRTGSGDAELVAYDVRLDSLLTLELSNLTRTCQDSYGSGSGPGGCAAPSLPTASPRPDPMVGAELVLTQGSRRWPLARLDTVTADLTAEVTATLPADARPGPASIVLADGGVDGTLGDLILR